MKQFFLTRIAFFFLAATFIALPLLKDHQILKVNDMSGNVINLLYIKDSLFSHGVFPQWNHILNYGIPIVADPLNGFFNPLVMISFILLPVGWAIKLIYLSAIFLSGIFSYLLLKKIKISEEISLLLPLTYMSGGYLAARIYAGHLEKILSYPLYPLLLLCLINMFEKKDKFWIGITALILSLFIWSGAAYEFLYAIIILILTGVFYFCWTSVKKKMIVFFPMINLLIIAVLTFLFSAFKILPLIEIGPFFDHIHDPLKGSQNFYSLVYNLFLPRAEIFKDYHLQSFLISPYYWWESFSYIGILPLICLILLLVVIKAKRSIHLFLFIFLFFMILGFSMMGSAFSPFHWLFTHINFLEQFRIPSRILVVLSLITLVLSSIVLDFFFRQKKSFLKPLIILVLLFNFLDTANVFSAKLTPDEFIYSAPLPDLGTLLNELEKKDGTYYYINQSELYQHHAPIDTVLENQQRLSQNYGFVLRKSFPFYINTYVPVHPKYFIYINGMMPPKDVTYREYLKGAFDSRVYKNASYTEFAGIYTVPAYKLTTASEPDKRIKEVSVENDKITVVADVNEKGKSLLVLESYAPGWKATLDGVDVALLKNDFLNVMLQNGKHTYVFTYFNNDFFLGALISFWSILLWAVYVFKNKLK